jgi:hypothetical protein
MLKDSLDIIVFGNEAWEISISEDLALFKSRSISYKYFTRVRKSPTSACKERSFQISRSL